MVVIRLARLGAKKRPFYHIVVADKRAAVQGKFIEKLGYYNPKAKEVSLEVERANDWISKGAQPSPRVQHLIKIHSKTAASVAA